MGSQQPEAIAIVGSACRFPGGARSTSAFLELLKTPRDVLQTIPQDRFDASKIYHPSSKHHATTNVQQSYLLQEDIRSFDAAFFNINPNEAESMDPQQRLLLETVYEALESGGHPIESLRGSDTAVYVGTMGVDYNETLVRDFNFIPTYCATGVNRAIISNRISYFFDWHGASMTIDTACSSSMIAVHHGVQALRTGESQVAVAGGTQVILEPATFIIEGKLNMLSPTARSRMWDADADGYARGEGVAAIVMKRLSDAIADGDHIECLIRGTGANQDGYSAGLTVPNSDAQASLIRQTYERAGLDLMNPNDRPQFFEAHGTGTKAGDPREAAAIHSCFGGNKDDDTPLYVGSVKTVVGHLEGTAGLAGILKGSGIIQRGFVPPNLLFNCLNPAIEPYYQGLHVPTVQSPWPNLPPGVPRRVSVNSFGFGGSNAHTILEEYCGSSTKTVDAPPSAELEPQDLKLQDTPFTPFVFSAMSEASLADQLQAYSSHLKVNKDIDTADLLWTLQSRRSQLPIRSAFSAARIDQLTAEIDKKLTQVKEGTSTNIGIRSNSRPSKSCVLGIFTGQGAQWATMGEHLVRSSDLVRRKFRDLEESLATLPPSDRPQWHLTDEMLASGEMSRISQAELSQPLCTAMQIVLVDLLNIAGIAFSAVVGHSSGEIAAAYAAGFISAHDAIRIAYYRGFYARRAGNSVRNQKGAMLAVGTSWEDAQDLINLRAFRGRLTIAAYNSSASITLSGDADATILAKKIFDEEKKFARILKVDTAYHSQHMLPCGDPYMNALRACGIRVNLNQERTSCSWFSSVSPSGEAMVADEGLEGSYWRDNMTNTVLFADAIKNAFLADEQLNLALEIGPHPALQGPAMQNISECRTTGISYCGTLKRGQNDIEAFSDTLGFIWTHFGAQGVDLELFEKAMRDKSSDGASRPHLVTELPPYPWNHARKHWYQSRKSRRLLAPKQVFNELLGVPSPDSNSGDLQWTNVLKVSEIAWLQGHQLQGQVVFPAAGYVVMALEAARSLAGNKTVELFEILDLTIPKAITFEENDDSGVETLFTLTVSTPGDRQDHRGQQQATSTSTTAKFSCYSCPVTASGDDMELMASGWVKIVYGNPSIAALASIPLDASIMSAVDTERFYSSLRKIGYGYYGRFQAMSLLKRSLNQASAKIATYPYTDADPTIYLVHPTYLDVAFQSSILAYSAPGDERLRSYQVPTSIGSIRMNPDICTSLPTIGTHVPVFSVLGTSESANIHVSIDIFDEGGQQVMIQVEDLNMVPLTPVSVADDRQLFSYTKWDFASPNGASIVDGSSPSKAEIEVANICERISYYYLRQWKSQITDTEWKNGEPHHLCLQEYMDHTLSLGLNGQHPYIKAEWKADSPETIKGLISSHSECIDIKLLVAVGENIPNAVRGQTTILQHMVLNNMLDDFYQYGIGLAKYHSFLASMMKQLPHRYPHANILEIGAGTGVATKSILECVGATMSSYTYTDVSADLLSEASKVFEAYSHKMTFKALDIEKLPASQGFEPHSYDFVIAANVLHATTSLKEILTNARQLLKPGGYLVLLEPTSNGPIRHNNILGGLPSWWLGRDDGRKYSPAASAGGWHTAMRQSGFSGIDTITPEVDVLTWPFSIIVTQAMDDRVQVLRRPLSHNPNSVAIDNLVILGTRSLASARIAEEVEEHLGRFCGQTTILDGLPTESDALSLDPMCTFINLVDIDSPIFKGVTAEKMNGLKRVYQLAKRILWVTACAFTEEPYHQASITFSRVVAHEEPDISLDHLDVSDLDDKVSQVIVEHLLRQCALDAWNTPEARQKSAGLLWSKEPEMSLRCGQLMVPRVVDNIDQDARLNSLKRAITKTVPISSSIVSIVLSAKSPPLVVEQPFPLLGKDDQNVVRIEKSSLMALHVVTGVFLFLGIGTNKATKETVVALSAT